MRDPFTELVLLAHKEEWCWKIACTTCGHLHFRYSFLLLTKGRQPSDPDWPIHWERMSHGEDPEVGSLPDRFDPEQQRTLLRLARELDLELLLEKCGSTTPLGALGLVLYHCERTEQMFGLLTGRLRGKIEDALEARGLAMHAEERPDRGSKRRWTYTDLARFESPLKQAALNKKAGEQTELPF